MQKKWFGMTIWPSRRLMETENGSGPYMHKGVLRYRVKPKQSSSTLHRQFMREFFAHLKTLRPSRPTRR